MFWTLTFRPVRGSPILLHTNCPSADQRVDPSGRVTASDAFNESDGPWKPAPVTNFRTFLTTMKDDFRIFPIERCGHRVQCLSIHYTNEIPISTTEKDLGRSGRTKRKEWLQRLAGSWQLPRKPFPGLS